MSGNKFIALFTVFLALVMFLIIQPGDNPLLVMKVATITATIVFLSTLLYNIYLWRVPPFSNMNKMIDISGTWEGNGKTKDGLAETMKLNIKQYYKDIKVKIVTNNFSSESLICRLKKETTGLFLYITYKSKNKDGVSSKEDIFYGTMIIGCDQDILNGEFFDSNNNHLKFELYRI